MVNVGTLRQQSALQDSDTPVIVVSLDEDMPRLEVVAVYPDTTDATGTMNRSFKIEVRRVR